MFLSDTSIRRPVLTTVVMAGILLAGWVGYRNLPVRELPDVEFPVVYVRTVLPGASPEVVETEVTEVLEEEINTVEGIKNLTSVSAEQVSAVTAEFQLTRGADFALQDVRAAVSRARGRLPDEIEDPVIQKLDPDAQPIIWVAVQNPSADLTDVNDVADNLVAERLQTLEGVGSIQLGGERRFAVRVRLDPDRMAARGVTVDDVRRALQTGNVEVPSGRIESRSREFTVRTAGELESPRAFEDLIVGWRGGAPVRVSDVGEAGPGVEDERQLARFDGKPTVGVGVVRQSGANTVAVSDRVLDRLEEIRAEVPPGYELTVAVNMAEFIEQSLEEVRETLLVAFGLVVLVVLLFLRSGRATLIPAAAIPVSVVGTFAVLYLFGFSVNTLTLLALVLAIGIVVDDAIVVVENIHRHIEEGEGAMEAARKGTAEIAFAVIAISLTLVIVFLPIAFMQGLVGRLFRQFGIAVAVSVLISAFVALTLSPMLSSRFLRREEGDGNRVFRAVERALERVTEAYRRALEWALDRRALVVGVAVGSLVVSLIAMVRMGKEFTPPEDRGMFMITVQAPVGSTLEYTDSYMRRIEEVMSGTEGVSRHFTAVGLGMRGPGAVNEGLAFVNLEEESERRDQFEIVAEVRTELRRLAGVDVFLISPSALAQGIEKPVQFVVQAADLDSLAFYADSLVRRAGRIPGLQGVDMNLDLNKPEYVVAVDRDRAAELGVSVADVGTTLQVLMGGVELSEFERGGERYEVVVQAGASHRATPEDLRSLYLRSRDGRLVQASSVVDVAEGVAPNQVNHYDRRRSVTVDANLEGISLGEGLERVSGLAAEVLPQDFTTTVAGQSQEFQESFSSLLFALLMAVVAVYLVLAGQFESFVHPFTIMLALPLALVGAVLSLWALGMTLNIYSMIGIIMLMGLVTKNSILLVDFANQARRAGAERRAAVVQAGRIRLRPILMTSISIVVGVMPIALALGAGAESRRPLGVAVAGGMVTSTALTLFVVPVFYLLLDDAASWVRRKLGRLVSPALSPPVVAAALLAGAAGAEMLAPPSVQGRQVPLRGQEVSSRSTGASFGAQEGRREAPLRLSVDEAVERAVRENEKVLIARAEQARVAGIEQEVRARALPDLTLNAGYTRNLQTPVIFFNTDEGVQQIRIGNDNEYAFGLSLSQTLFDPALGAAQRAAGLSREATAVEVRAARNDVALQARIQYYTVLLGRELVRVQEQALEQAESRLDQVRAMRRAGTGSEFDTLTARVEVDNVRPDLIEARNRLELDRRRLKRIVGVGMEREIALTDSLAPPPEDERPAPLEELVERALAGREDLRGQALRVDLFREDLISRRNADLPSLSLDMALNRRASSSRLLPPEEDFSQSAFAALRLSIPLFDGRATAGRVQQARASVDRERFRLQRQREQVRLEVREARQNLTSARERIRASESNVARAERALEIARVRFRNGLSTQVELNDAELAVTRARTNHARALHSYHVARARLTAALGER